MTPISTSHANGRNLNRMSRGRTTPRAMARRAGRSDGFHAVELLEQRQLFVADPITVSHPTWFANYGTVVVDGILNDAEWAGTVPIVRAQPNRPDSSVTMRMKYTQLGLYIGFDVRDQYIWADGGGGGSGLRYDWFDDDSMALFFDSSVTRKRLLTPNGRALAFNIGNPNGPLTGSGVVTRYNYIRGNNPNGNEGDMNGVGVNPGNALSPGMTWKTVINGTPNNNSDIDVGWTTEVFLPWSSINMVGMPVNGQNITMNFSVLFDESGGTHDHAARDQDPNAAIRFGPRTIDDQVDGVPSSFNVSMPGMEGPIDYAWLVFTDGRTTDKPNPVINLSAGSVDGYGARLNFLAPAASQAVMALGPAKRGGVYQYDIRWSDVPITDEASWDAATDIHNTFVPKPRGMPESLRIGNLEPDTFYYVAIRTVDTAGRLSDISQVTFTTQNTTQDTSGGDNIMISPGGGSLVTESGTPWVMVGSSLIPNTYYARNLYPGDVWDAGHSRYINFGTNPGPEGSPDGYFDSLAANGVNTLRVTMEWLATPVAGQTQAPRGTYWLEYPAGHYNPDMKTFLLSTMAEAARTGMKLILKPFDTFDYKTFFNLTAYSAANGGPLTSINDFFQSTPMITMVANRVKTIIDWANSSPYAATVLGIELPNEWDDWTWTLNARGDGDPSRTQEMRDRSKFILRAAAQIHAYSPDTNLVSSTDGVVPRGPEARALFLGDGLDILAPHWYTATTMEPVNNPDADKSIRPVTDYAGLAGYWSSNRRDSRVVVNGEWGLVNSQWQGGKVYYTGVSPVTVASKPWTVQNDVDMYRTTSWAQIAAGLGGNGFRLGGQEMRDLIPANIGPNTTGYLPLPLPQGMRDVQQTVAEFASDDTLGFDYANYNSRPLAGHVRMTGTAKNLITVGSTDGEQGMLYVLQNDNATTGNVVGASAVIDGLTSGDYIDVEFWSTGSGGQQIDTQWGLQVVNGKLTIPLPTFSRDVMVRFKAALT